MSFSPHFLEDVLLLSFQHWQKKQQQQKKKHPVE